MTVTPYTNVNGQILCQSKGRVVSHFVSDPLGSVVLVRDTAGATVYEAEYDPYGNVQSETGTNPSELGFVGTLGYIKDSATALYIRARYLLTNLARWQSKDPLWPGEPSFSYAHSAPTYITDFTGEGCTSRGSGPCACSASDEAVCKARCNKAGQAYKGCRCIPILFFILPCPWRLFTVCLRRCDCFPKGKCPPKPADDFRLDQGRTRPHYDKHAKPPGCCCGAHIHYYTYHQGPPPACKVSRSETHVVCLKDFRPYEDCSGCPPT